MKITSKITLLVCFLLLVLAVNTLIGLDRTTKIGRELKDVVNKDIVLTGISTSVTQDQLKKAILFERILNMVEELGFQKINDARHQYLSDEIVRTERAFQMLTRQSAVEIMQGKKIIVQGISDSPFEETRREFQSAQESLLKIEKAHIEYDELVSRVFGLIAEEGYQISLEDLYGIEQKEKYLSAQLRTLTEQIQRYTKQSLVKADLAENQAKNFLLVSLVVSMVLSLLVAISIVKGISKPLERLIKATYQIGVGNLVANLDDSSKDEIGKLSSAFNEMSAKILDFRVKLQDQNERLAKNLALTEAQKRDLERVNKELDQFVYTVSHDIAAPLMGIIGYGDYLAKHYSHVMDEQGIQCLEKIRKAAFKLNAMIKDLLTLTRLSRIKNPYEHVSMKEVVVSVVERLEYSIRKFNVDFSVQEYLPTIVCDRIKITEVFYNLISNAIKFSSKNVDQRPKVEVGYADRAVYHEFFVKDNGIGIAAQDHEAVFEVFKRLKTSQDYEGTGAGLGIVASVIKDHGGRVWVESELGKGAIFCFTIPKNLKKTADFS